jgi:hypothetical protein
MEILKRLLVVLLWVAFIPSVTLLILFVGGLALLEQFITIDIDDEIYFQLMLLFIIFYPLIVLTRWILFKEWIFLPWQKTKNKGA